MFSTLALSSFLPDTFINPGKSTNVISCNSLLIKLISIISGEIYYLDCLIIKSYAFIISAGI